MKTTRTHLIAERHPWSNDRLSITVYMTTIREGQHTNAVMEPAQFRLLKPEECVSPPPTFELSPEDAQRFMDELWRAGVRPADSQGSIGQLSAVTAHLNDMRRLVFDGSPPAGAREKRDTQDLVNPATTWETTSGDR